MLVLLNGTVKQGKGQSQFVFIFLVFSERQVSQHHMRHFMRHRSVYILFPEDSP